MNTINKNNPNIWTLKSNDKEENKRKKNPQTVVLSMKQWALVSKSVMGEEEIQSMSDSYSEGKIHSSVGRRMWHIYS